MYKKMDDTKFTFVNTEATLKYLITHLEGVTEVAIDLEHHNYRTYLGITCLMQISTREEDFIVDTLVLRPILHKLQPCFTNPNILKVLHGADMDILWL